jgi:hypothetical protein
MGKRGTVTHFGFESQLSVGAPAEVLFRNMAGSGLYVSDHLPIAEECRLGADYAVARHRAPDDVRLVEVKNHPAGDRRNACFIETVSKDTTGAVSWLFKHAHAVCFWFPIRKVWVVSRRRALETLHHQWRRAYPERRIKNDGYNTLGYYVPVECIPRRIAASDNTLCAAVKWACWPEEGR